MSNREMTITVHWHNLPEYLRKLATRKAIASVSGTTMLDVVEHRVLFELSCPANPRQEERKLVGIIYTNEE